MSKPAKKSARERLVAYYRMGVGCEDPRCGSCKHFAKLLRAHERELAELWVRAALQHVADVLCDCPGRGFWPEREVAAILGKRGKRGAK